MEICQYCGSKISEAKFLLMNNRVYKSCPGCSQKEDKHVFYMCPENFGMTQKRISTNNPLGLQSHCVKCRANKKEPHEGAILCSNIHHTDGVIVSEIRFLPMSSEVFATYEEAKKFILNELPDRDGIYYFRKSKMNCADDAFVMFQYGGELIGYAIYKSIKKLEKPRQDGYTGYYKFVTKSIRVLKRPITVEQFKKIDSEFKNFNQSHQRKPVGLLPMIFQCIAENNGTIAGRDYVLSLPEEINEQEAESLKEGQKKQIVVNAYERNPVARERCLSYYKKLNHGRIKCEICGFDFGKVYGKEFEGKIHIHHLKEIASIGAEYVIDAEKDLIPICPNCHMVAHSRKPAITPEEIKKLLNKR